MPTNNPFEDAKELLSQLSALKRLLKELNGELSTIEAEQLLMDYMEQLEELIKNEKLTIVELTKLKSEYLKNVTNGQWLIGDLQKLSLQIVTAINSSIKREEEKFTQEAYSIYEALNKIIAGEKARNISPETALEQIDHLVKRAETLKKTTLSEDVVEIAKLIEEDISHLCDELESKKLSNFDFEGLQARLDNLKTPIHPQNSAGNNPFRENDSEFKDNNPFRNEKFTNQLDYQNHIDNLNPQRKEQNFGQLQNRLNNLKNTQGKIEKNPFEDAKELLSQLSALKGLLKELNGELSTIEAEQLLTDYMEKLEELIKNEKLTIVELTKLKSEYLKNVTNGQWLIGDLQKLSLQIVTAINSSIKREEEKFTHEAYLIYEALNKIIAGEKARNISPETALEQIDHLVKRAETLKKTTLSEDVVEIAKLIEEDISHLCDELESKKLSNFDFEGLQARLDNLKTPIHPQNSAGNNPFRENDSEFKDNNPFRNEKFTNQLDYQNHIDNLNSQRKEQGFDQLEDPLDKIKEYSRQDFEKGFFSNKVEENSSSDELQLLQEKIQALFMQYFRAKKMDLKERIEGSFFTGLTSYGFTDYELTRKKFNALQTFEKSLTSPEIKTVDDLEKSMKNHKVYRDLKVNRRTGKEDRTSSTQELFESFIKESNTIIYDFKRNQDIDRPTTMKK